MRITVLGSTGSIGRNTLDVIARHPQNFELFALTGSSQVDILAQQCMAFRPRFAVMPDPDKAQDLRQMLRTGSCPTEVLSGAQALDDVAKASEVDAVMAAIVGAAGLRPALAAALAGKRLMLANKESLVIAGALFMRAVKEGGAILLPVDSEHSAIFQCLPESQAAWPDVIEKLILTASGGPFRTRDLATLSNVTPQEACAHPNWNMGRKISVDSATMMNKALEIIEARWLFGVAPSQIQAVIHPQSIVHSMVLCRDGSTLAQLGVPDMRVPIAVSLAWPRRMESGAKRLDFTQLPALTFEAPDEKRFPCLSLAWQALVGPEGTTAILNAANEEAVRAFLEGRLRFDQIYNVVAIALETLTCASGPKMLDDLFALDHQARALARSVIDQLRT